MVRPSTACILIAFVLSGCMSAEDTDSVTSNAAYRSIDAPPGAAPGTCWSKVTSPAIIETVTEQIVVEGEERAEDGTLVRPAQYRTETHQVIVRERKEMFFETPCAEALTTEFVSSLQRALAARDLFDGDVNGSLDMPTRDAIRAYQKEDGIDSAVLAIDTARKLGLVAAKPLE